MAWWHLTVGVEWWQLFHSVAWCVAAISFDGVVALDFRGGGGKRFIQWCGDIRRRGSGNSMVL